MTTDTNPKADLKRDFPGWNIIHTDRGRWWAQLFPIPSDRSPRENVVEDATAEGLRKKLTAAES